MNGSYARACEGGEVSNFEGGNSANGTEDGRNVSRVGSFEHITGMREAGKTDTDTTLVESEIQIRAKDVGFHV